MSDSTSPIFLRDRHVKYWLRCVHSQLPSPYMSADSNRMLLAFFIISALDLLDVLEMKTSSTERAEFVSWIYSCQLPDGGFRGFSGTDFGQNKRTKDNEAWDPANVPATFFALVTLIVLGDDLSRVRRKGCLDWLPKLQRENGSFGEILGEDEAIEGGSDLRFCCCAAGIRYILRGPVREQNFEGIDLDTAKLVAYIQSCQTYDGGFSEAPLREAHSGLTYCAVGALSFLGRIPEVSKVESKIATAEGIDYEELLRWLVARQTSYIEDDYDDDIEQDEGGELPATSLESPHRTHFPASSQPGATSLDDKDDDSPSQVLDLGPEDLIWLGLNGRPNKIADTCYCFWNTGALAMLNRVRLIDCTGLRNYLVGKTQHIVGGFGKAPGEPPDVLHAYLGLAALATMGYDNLPSIDPTLCISNRAQRRLESLPWWKNDESQHSEVNEEAGKNNNLPGPDLSYLAISGG